MVQIDFTKIDDLKDYEPLPDGQYQCRLADVTEATTRNGDQMWKLKHVVTSGQFEGRYIFDNLVFSQAAMSRVKLICSALGLDVTQAVELNPDDLFDRACAVTVITEEYSDFEGYTKSTNRVPFGGYEPAAAPVTTAVGQVGQ